jgi:hypothetical protein
LRARDQPGDHTVCLYSFLKPQEIFRCGLADGLERALAARPSDCGGFDACGRPRPLAARIALFDIYQAIALDLQCRCLPLANHFLVTCS